MSDLREIVWLIQDFAFGVLPTLAMTGIVLLLVVIPLLACLDVMGAQARTPPAYPEAAYVACANRCWAIQSTSPDPLAGWRVTDLDPCTCGVVLEVP